MRFSVLHRLAILVVIVINYLLNSLPIMYVIIFARRVVGPWNRLPVDIDFSSLARFKASVKRTDLSNCLLYCVN